MTGLMQVLPKETIKTGRLPALDGLRGLLALFVVFFHLWIIDAPAARAFNTDTDAIDHSPLAIILQAGSYPVLIFFALSGLSLTLPVLAQKDKFNWLAYYPSRLIRLYLPVVLSIALSVVLACLVKGDNRAPGNQWLLAGAIGDVKPKDVFAALTLNLTGNPGGPDLNLALWSLQWEILFSIGLPLFIFICLWLTKRLSILNALGVVILCGAISGYTGIMPLYYFACFGVGIILARYSILYKPDTTNGGGIRITSPMSVLLLLGLSVVLYWLAIESLTGFPANMLRNASPFIVATLLILLTFSDNFFTRWLKSSPLQFLGRVSFSLYLVHVPIIIALAYLMPRELWLLHIFVAAMAALVISWLFYRFLERPSHKLANMVKRNIAVKIPRHSLGDTTLLRRFLNYKLF